MNFPMVMVGGVLFLGGVILFVAGAQSAKALTPPAAPHVGYDRNKWNALVKSLSVAAGAPDASIEDVQNGILPRRQAAINRSRFARSPLEVFWPRAKASWKHRL
jgi:hypothetical protein